MIIRSRTEPKTVSRADRTKLTFGTVRPSVSGGSPPSASFQRGMSYSGLVMFTSTFQEAPALVMSDSVANR